jgi:hypothetical protein
MATANNLYVSINDDRIKLEGEALEAYLADQVQLAAYEAELKKIREEKEAARAAVLAKLGLTPEEAKLLLA